jgi:MoaA/NifB/PqqE/SkfB family radical SAM enzyme
MNLNKYQVVSLHFDTDCNLSCPMCYRPKNVDEKEKTDYMFWLECVPHIKQITDQVAIGGGEPFLHPDFIMKFAEEAKKHDLIVNVTTNGTIQIKPEWIENVKMVSVSYDRYKWPKAQGFKEYLKTTRELKDIGNIKVGCNFLMEDWLLKDYKMLAHMLIHIFGIGKVDAIFALMPKKTKAPDILRHARMYQVFTYLFDEFYVDDCTRMILVNKKYGKWREPCHFASDMVSIDERRNVTGCSFSEDPLMILEKPEDILKIPKIKYKKRYGCPYLEVDKNENTKSKL